MITFVNCTPHPINVVDADTKEVIMSLPKGEVVPRLSQTTKVVDKVNRINITETVFGNVEDLPAEKEDTLLIVSRLVLSACKDRKDLIVPNGLVRDEEGNILGCESFARS